MSQFFVNSSSGGGGGGDVTQLNTQNGNAVAIAGVILLNAYDTSADNDNGIETKGGTSGGDPPGTGATNETDVYLTNRVTGTVSTTTTTQIPIITFPMGSTPGTFYVYGNVQAFDPNTPAGGGFSFSGAYRTNGTLGVELGKEFHDDFKSITFMNADINLDVSVNSIIVSVIGLNLVPIRWSALMEYRRVL